VSNVRKISERSANIAVNSLYFIGNHEVGNIMMVVVSNIEVASIFLDHGTISHKFTD